MQLGKVLLGVAVGIGAVAVAPITGGGSVLAAGVSLTGSLAGAGAATAGAAVVGGGIGAAAGSKDEDNRREERQQAKEQGFRDGKVEGEAATKKKVNGVMNDLKKRDNYLIALTALCYAAANCDGKITEEELDELDYNLNYIKDNAALSAPLKGFLTKIKNRKDSFDKITKKLDRLDVSDLPKFTEIVDNIIEADGVLAPEEIAFKKQWIAYCEQRNA